MIRSMRIFIAVPLSPIIAMGALVFCFLMISCSDAGGTGGSNPNPGGGDDGNDETLTPLILTPYEFRINNFDNDEIDPTGLAVFGDKIYMTGRSGALYEVDGDGRATSVTSDTLNTIVSTGLAAIGNTLYVIDDRSLGGDTLYQIIIDSSNNARAERVGALGILTPSGLAAIGETLYVININTRALYTVNRGNGSTAKVGSTELGIDRPTGLAAIGNTLYVVDDDTDMLYTVDTTTGMATPVLDDGSVVNSFGLGVSDIAPAALTAVNNNGADVLYMAVASGEGLNNATIYVLNPDDGTATARLAPTRPFPKNDDAGRDPNVHGMVAVDDTIYVLNRRRNGGDAPELYAINSTAGTFSEIEEFRNSPNIVNGDALTGLAYSGSEILYFINRTSPSNSMLYGFNITDGSVTKVGSDNSNLGITVGDGSGLSFHGALYLANNGDGSLYTINRDTGVASPTDNSSIVCEGILPIVCPPNGSFDLASDGTTLYLVDEDTSGLYTLDTTDGIATIFGVLPIEDPFGLAAIGRVLYIIDGSRTPSFYTHTVSSGDIPAAIRGSLLNNNRNSRLSNPPVNR